MCRALFLMLLMQFIQQPLRDKYSVPITGTEIYITGYKEALCHLLFVSPLVFPSSLQVPPAFIVLCIQHL